jgi:dihydrofolate synthase/folylpolyglutamate synthase
VVTAPQSAEALEVIACRCRSLQSPLYRFGKDFEAGWSGSTLTYRGMTTSITDISPGIGGRYQAENAAAAMAAAELLANLGHAVSPLALKHGVEKAQWPGRMEVFPGVPPVILDGAHNPAGAHALVESLAGVMRKRLIIVIGVMGDKDLAGIAGPLVPLAAEVVAVSPALPRALPAALLAGFCRRFGVSCHDGGTVADGLAAARQLSRQGDVIVVTGSLFTVGEARSVLSGRPFEPIRG